VNGIQECPLDFPLDFPTPLFFLFSSFLRDTLTPKLMSWELSMATMDGRL